MSVEVERIQPGYLNFPFTDLERPPTMSSLAAGSVCHISQSCGLAMKVKTPLSRSREASPCDVRPLAYPGYFSSSTASSSVGSASPKVLQKTQVKGIHQSTSSTSLLKTSETLITKTVASSSSSSSCQTSSASLCDKLKNLSVSGTASQSAATNVLSPDEVASRLDQSSSSPSGHRPLLLDCRPFIAFNMVHIKGALSVNCCDRITKKRITCGKIHLVDIISGNEAKNKFRQHEDSADIIVYDEETEELDEGKTSPASSLRLVVSYLQKEGRKVFYVKGGLSSFQRDHPAWCYKPDYKPPPKLLYSPTTPAVVDDQIDAAVISEILPFLYIGNERDVANLDLLREHGITHVLNVTSHIPLHFESQGIIYKRLPASDSGSQNLKQYFTEAFKFIEEVKNTGGKILVHCQAGVSRSATISISYIMRHQSMTMMEAFHFVKARRSIVSPNFNFMGQLYELETQLSGGKTPNHLGPPPPFELQMRCADKI